MILTKLADRILDRYDDLIKYIKSVNFKGFSFSSKILSFLSKLFSWFKSAIAFLVSPIAALALKYITFEYVVPLFKKPDVEKEPELDTQGILKGLEEHEYLDTTVEPAITAPIEPEEAPEVESSKVVKPKEQSETFFNSLIGNTVVTSPYGYRKSTKSFHYGVDLRAKVGTPIRAPFDGTVIQLRNNLNDRGGRNIFLISKSGIILVVMHLSKITVQKGRFVKKGQIIGYTGSSGYHNENAYISHLHLQVGRIENKKYKWYDPQKFNYFESAESSVSGRTAYFKESVKKAMRLFTTNLSLTPNQAAGIVGNLIGESQLNPQAFNPSGGGRGAQGIAQWRGVRISRFKELYGIEPKDSTFDKQLSYVVHEFNTYFKSTLKSLKQSSTIEASTKIILEQYERPNNPEALMQSRIRFAKEALSIWLNTDILNSKVKEYNFSSSNYSTNIRNQ